MRDLRTLDRFRVQPLSPFPSVEGAFIFGAVRVIACSGDGWDHVSVSLVDRCPTWTEMEKVKRTFFKDDEVAMQLHLPPVDHINCHPFVLHLWRPHTIPIPLPPKDMV